MLCGDQCFLCGISIARGSSRRYQPIDKMQALLQTRCIMTPLVYQALLAFPASSQREPLCIPCVNWKRRLESGTSKRKKVYLQVGYLF